MYSYIYSGQFFLVLLICAFFALVTNICSEKEQKSVLLIIAEKFAFFIFLIQVSQWASCVVRALHHSQFLTALHDFLHC